MAPEDFRERSGFDMVARGNGERRERTRLAHNGAHRGAERSSMGSLRTLGGRIANTASDVYLLNLLLLSAA